MIYCQKKLLRPVRDCVSCVHKCESLQCVLFCLCAKESAFSVRWGKMFVLILICFPNMGFFVFINIVDYMMLSILPHPQQMIVALIFLISDVYSLTQVYFLQLFVKVIFIHKVSFNSNNIQKHVVCVNLLFCTFLSYSLFPDSGSSMRHRV